MSALLHFLTEPAHLLTAAGLISCLWMLYEYLRRREHRLLAFLAGSGSGIAALLLIRLHGGLFGFYPRLTLPVLGTAFVCGIPGVLLLWLLEWFRI